MLIGILLFSVMLGSVTLALQEGALSSSSTPVADLAHRINTLESMSDVIGKQMAQAGHDLANLKSVTDRTIEQLHGSRLALALLQLRIASQTHFPFEAELALVRQLAKKGDRVLSETMTALTPYAATGVATVSELRDSFGLILLPKLEPLLQENEHGWFDWAFTWISLLVPFNASTMQPTSRQQLVIAATDRLTEDDLHGAVEQVTQLDGSAAALVVRWLKEANARLAVDAAYNSLSGIAVALLGHL